MKKRGFTLAELLIVTAIIAVLTAIAIPVFSQQLEKARETVDLYNIRTAYSEVCLAITEGSLSPPTETAVLPGGMTATATYSYHPSGAFYLMRVFVHGFSYKQKDLSKWLISTEWEVNGSKIPMVWDPEPLNPTPVDPSDFRKNDKYLQFVFMVNPGSSIRLLAISPISNII